MQAMNELKMETLGIQGGWVLAAIRVALAILALQYILWPDE